MRILLVQDTDWLVRGPHQQHHLMEKLALRGHEVRVIDFELLWRTHGNKELSSHRQVFPDVSKIYPGGRVTVIRPGILKIPLLDYVSLIFTHRKEINRQIKEFQPDIIIGFGILGTYTAMKLAKRHRVPFVYYLIDVLHTLVPFKPARFIAKALTKRILKNANAVIALNNRLKDFLITMGAEAGHTCVVTAGVDLDRFKTDTDGSEIRRQYGIPESAPVLLFMGYLGHSRGLTEIASEFINLVSTHPELKLLIVGEGEFYNELAEVRERHKMEDSLILTGRQPYAKIPEFLAAADVCLLPFEVNDLTREIVPIKLYEYMASGKPVVATDLPGVRREMGDDKGIIYADDPAAVIVKAAELLNNSTNLADCGRKNRSYMEKLSWENITDEFEEILRRVGAEK